MPQFANLPNISAGYGLKTPFGITLPPGGRVAAYVRGTTGTLLQRSNDDAAITSRLVATLAAGLAECRSGAGDTVVVLPGHTENVADATMLDGLVAGTRVIGVGNGSNKPTFRWTATGSKWNIAVADCVFAGLKLKVEGANGVVKGLYVTGADTVIADNEIIVSSGASNKAAIVCEFDTGADRFVLSDNKVYGLLAGAVVDGFLITAALTDWEIRNNRMIFPGTAVTKGCINVAGASLNGYIGYNSIYNIVAASTVGIYFADVASDGLCEWNTFGATTGTATAPAVTGVVLAGTNTLWRFNQNFSTPTKNTSGLLTPVADS